MRHALRLMVLWGVGAALTGAACHVPAFYTTVLEARRSTAELRLQFIRAADASNRAVMTAGEGGAGQDAGDAARGLQAVRQQATALRPLLVQGGLSEELKHLDAFLKSLSEYESVDRQILELAADGSNVRARRLAAGAGQDSADAFRRALEAAVQGLATPTALQAALAAAKAQKALVEIQLLESRHIPEPDDAVMTRLEAGMVAPEREARAALDDLRRLLPGDRRVSLDAAAAALDRFAAIHAEVITLSRRNSNVHSLALTMGRKRGLTLSCDESLAALETALAKYRFTGTR